MAIVSTPSGNSTLPTAGTQMTAAPITGWITAIRSFLDEASNIDEANVDLTGSDGIVGKSTAQTITGAKTFSDITITNLRSLGYLTTMQGIALRVTADEAISAGDLVYVSSWDGTNGRFGVKQAVATNVPSTTLYARYVSPAAITNGAAGTVYSMYVLDGLNTSALTLGRPVYLGLTPGDFSGTQPPANNLIQIVGWVVTVNATTGRVAIELPGQIIPFSISDQV